MSAGGERKAKVTIDYPSQWVVAPLRLAAHVLSKALWSIRFHGLENIPSKTSGGLVVVANHPTYFDPAWVSLKLKRRLKFMAWDEAFQWTFIGPAIRYLGAFPVKLRSGPSKSSIVESLRSLRDGAALVIFPEGEREFADGRLHPFKPGAVHIALAAGAPILPVSIRGANSVWPQGQKYPRFFRRVEVTFHPLVKLPENAAGQDRDDVADMISKSLMTTIADAIA